MEKTMDKVIPFVDLKQQYALHQEAFEDAIKNVCLSSSFILGTEVKRFERTFANYIGVKESIGVASGTDALRLSCRALEIGPGDEVLVPANTFIASALGVYDVGATVVPVDVDPESFLMDLYDAKKRITRRTKAMLPVHLYGRIMNMDEVAAFADAYDLIVIEDACQSHGAMWNGKRAGSFGAVGCFSFFPSKNLGAFGDGGLITTNDQGIASRLKLLRNYGSTEKYMHEVPGTNSRLDSLQAAILNVKMTFLDDWNRKRFLAACRYIDRLKTMSNIKPPALDRNDTNRNVFHLFVIQCDDRDDLVVHLNEQGIECGIHYPVPIHLHGAFKSLGYPGNYPVAEGLAGKILSLPIFPEITEEQINYVVDSIREFYG